jgi:Flp pilus assembly protein TadG
VIRLRRRHERTERGQGLVEFAMLVPVFMLLLLGLLEFGFVFDHTMTVSYATREGARSGAAFAQGNATTMVCADVDKNIIAAVQRVLKAPGSLVTISNIANVTIYRAQADGTPFSGAGNNNVWVYNAGGGPVVDGANLDFSWTSGSWNACTRSNGASPDSLGVSILYNYRYVTPLSAALGFFGPPGGAGLTIRDRTVMALNPIN